MNNDGDRRRLPRPGDVGLLALPLALVALVAGDAFSAGGANGWLPLVESSRSGRAASG